MNLINNYTDYLGMIHTVPTGPAQTPSTNNSVGTTSLYYGLLQLNTSKDVSPYWLHQYPLMVLDTGPVAPNRPVLTRAHSQIQQGPDDYICFFFASSILNFYCARNIMINEKKLFGFIPYYWNNECPGTTKTLAGKFNSAAIFLRFPGLLAQGKIASYVPKGEVKLNWFNKLVFALSLYISAKKPFSKQDTWMQTDMMIKTYLARVKIAKMPRVWIIDKAIEYWTKKKGDKKIKDIFVEYSNDPNHPLAEIWIENEEAFPEETKRS